MLTLLLDNLGRSKGQLTSAKSVDLPTGQVEPEVTWSMFRDGQARVDGAVVKRPRWRGYPGGAKSG